MKRDGLVFAAAFLLAFFMLAAGKDATSESLSESNDEKRSHTSSSRSQDEVATYVDAILSQEEKLQLELEQANSLSELLGLVERMPMNDQGNYGYAFEAPAEKLAKLYPAESLRYYANRPTDYKMNEKMWWLIAKSWAATDITACLTYLEHGQALAMFEFCGVWGDIVKKEWDEKSAEILINFSQMSAEKQKAIFQRDQMDESILSKLRPQMKTPLAHSVIEPKQNDRQENHLEGRDIFEKKIDDDEMARNHLDAMVQDIIDRKLAPMDLETLLRDVKSRNDRQSIVLEVLQKRGSDGTIEGWLERVKETMAVVSDIPDYPPAWRTKVDNSAYEALEKWIPHQSTKIQRAWADNVVNQMYGEDAMEWIDTLSQASLRADLRDQHLERWVRNSPSYAAEYIVEKATAFEKEDYLPTAVYRWALQDYAAAQVQERSATE